MLFYSNGASSCLAIAFNEVLPIAPAATELTGHSEAPAAANQRGFRIRVRKQKFAASGSVSQARSDSRKGRCGGRERLIDRGCCCASGGPIEQIFLPTMAPCSMHVEYRCASACGQTYLGIGCSRPCAYPAAATRGSRSGPCLSSSTTRTCEVGSRDRSKHYLSSPLLWAPAAAGDRALPPEPSLVRKPHPQPPPHDLTRTREVLWLRSWR